MGFEETIKNIYYGFEDKYYDVLDKIDGAGVPIYKVIDPIDQIFPSFILVIIFIILLGVLLLIGIMSAVQGTATFIVEDENGDPLPDILVTLSNGEQEEIKTTDAFGEFQTSFFGENIDVEVDENDFEKYNEEFNVQAGGTYTIRLESESSSLKAKTIRFQIRDETQKLLDNSVNVTMNFGCSGNASPPSSFSRTGGRQQVTTQTNCGTLTTTINATGFKEKSKSINVATHEGIVLINLEKDELFGTIRVLVKDASTSEEISGVSLKLKKNGVPFINGGTTDATGAKVISRVPVGTYIIEAIPKSDSGYINGFSSAFSLTANDARSNRPVEIAIFLRKTEQTKKILLKFIDTETDDPIEDVEAQIVADNIYTLKLFSNEKGIVEYINADENVNYSVIAIHDDYLVKVTEDLPVIGSSSNNELTIKLEKITEPDDPEQNFANARIIVTDFAGEPVPNASTRLNAVGLEFPIGIGLTGSDGTTEFNNLPISEYNAHAEKTISGILYKDDSENKTLISGETTDFLLSLVISEGSLEVEVLDESTGEPVPGAVVRFIDYISGSELANEITDVDGKTEKVSFKANRVPYVHVESDGFYDFITIPYNIVPNNSQKIVVELVREEEFNSFDIELVDILKDGRSTKRINDNEQYTFKFNLLLAQQSNDVEVVIRTGLEENGISEDSVIVVRSADSIGSEVLSDCYDQLNNYADCRPDDVTIDAKQIIIDMGDLDTGVYEILVTTFVKEVVDDEEDDTIIEVRFGAKTKVGGNTIFRKTESELYLWRDNLNVSFCFREDCGVDFVLQLQDLAQILMPTPIDLEDGKAFDQPLVKDETYVLSFETSNLGEDTHEDVQLTINNDPEVLTIPTDPVDIGRFAPLAVQSGSFNFGTPTDTASTSLGMSLGLGVNGDSPSVLFTVSSFKEMILTLSPNELKPNTLNQQIRIDIIDADQNPVEEVDIMVWEQITSAPITGGTTSPEGIVFVEFENSYLPGIIFEIEATKTGFDTINTTIEVTGLKPLFIKLNPTTLAPNQTNTNLEITITDEDGNPVSGAMVEVIDIATTVQEAAGPTNLSGVFTAQVTTGDPTLELFEIIVTKGGFTDSSDIIGVSKSGPGELDCITINGASVDEAQFTIGTNEETQEFELKNDGCDTDTDLQITTINNQALILQFSGQQDPYTFGSTFTLNINQSINITATSANIVGNHPLFITAFIEGTSPPTGNYTERACLSSTSGNVSCTLEQGSCQSTQVGIVSLSKETNAVIGPFEGTESYATKVCCTIPGENQDNCEIRESGTGTRLISVSNITNAHAALASDTNPYNWSVYCPAATGNSCADGTPILNLSEPRNAHVQLGAQGTPEDELFAGTAHIEVFDASVCLGGGSQGNTGTDAAPRIKYDWDPAKIKLDTCDPTNPDYIVCDSTQFSISLLKRLQSIDGNANTEGGEIQIANALASDFEVYLMRDAFSDDFKQDFHDYLAKIFEPEGFIYVPWDKYFPTSRLTIDSGTPPHEPGRYKVSIAFLFGSSGNYPFFATDGSANGTIHVELKKIDDLPDKSLFYYLPIDADLGITDEGIHRDGYGVGFDGEEDIPISLSAKFLVNTVNMTSDSNPIAIIKPEKLDTFVEVHKDNAGKVFSISQISGEIYEMKFAPSVPNPVIIKATGNGDNISASYIIAENGVFVTTDQWITRLREITVQDESGNYVCEDPPDGSGISLPTIGTTTDEQAILYADEKKCQVISQTDHSDITFGFNRESGDNVNVFFETIFYTPKNSEVIISNECADQGIFYIANLTDDGQVSANTPFEEVLPGENHKFSNAAKLKTNSIEELVQTITTEETCITQGIGSTGVPNTVALWWNEDVLLEDLRNAVAATGIEVNACFLGS